MNDTERDELLTATAEKVAAIHQDWFGPQGKDGLRDVLLATRDRSLENKNTLSNLNRLVWGAGLIAFAAVTAAFGWLFTKVNG